MSDAIPLDQIKKPTFTKLDVKAAVETLDPTRHERTVEYEFSNSRTFKRLPDYTD